MDDLKAKRSAALEEKRRRLEELKARRNQRSTSTKTSSAVSASKSGNLDEYIDGLLNSAAPVVPSGAASASSSSSAATQVEAVTPRRAAKKMSKIDEMNQQAAVAAALASPSPAVGMGLESPVRNVETFTMATQTEDDDFPMPLVSSDDEGEVGGQDDDVENNEAGNGIGNGSEEDEMKESEGPEPALLTEEQVSETISSEPFSSFVNSASRKVERLLGRNLLSDLLVDDTQYYADKESKRDASTSTREKKDSLISARVSFAFPKWTANRDVTSLDWSPHHRGEIMLASYHMPSFSKSAAVSTVVSGVASNDHSSASLFPRSKTEMTNADGLTILWNLAMPSRPEHIFTCGSPVLNAKFHPTEGSLIVGACYSGQVVVWDVRTGGRLPVQKSSLNLLGGSGGHVHPVVGLETLDSGFVSAASDGTVNFWSPANLMEPAESIVVPGANISSLAVAPGSETLLVGDESGSIHAILPSASSSSKRNIIKLNSDVKSDINSSGHYGNVTGLSTKPPLRKGSNVGIAKGFARGANGLVLSSGIDWQTVLWAPAYTDKPLLSFLSHSYDYMSDVKWSPVHPSVFATASSNGSLGLWNLATSLDEPITGPHGLLLDKNDANPELPSHGVNKIKWSLDGRRIAAARSDTVHVLGLTEELWKPKGNEGAKVMNSLRSRGLIDGED